MDDEEEERGGCFVPPIQWISQECVIAPAWGCFGRRATTLSGALSSFECGLLIFFRYWLFLFVWGFFQCALLFLSFFFFFLAIIYFLNTEPIVHSLCLCLWYRHFPVSCYFFLFLFFMLAHCLHSFLIDWGGKKTKLLKNNAMNEFVSCLQAIIFHFIMSDFSLVCVLNMKFVHLMCLH